jgi:hypothetical protein
MSEDRFLGLELGGQGRTDYNRVKTPEELNLRPKRGQRLIHLTQGYVTIVSAHRYDDLSQHAWCASCNRHNGNVYAMRRGKKFEGARWNKSILLAREITGLTDELLVVDHFDGNSLNNTDQNLLVTTKSWNNHNHVYVRGKCLYRGVDVQLRRGITYFRARLAMKGRNYELGWFRDPVEAAMAYDDKVFELLGPFAWTNFPRGVRDPKFVEVTDKREESDVPF